MKKYIALSLVLISISFSARSQGCIAVRNLVGFGQLVMPDSGEEPLKWLVNANSRYFESWKTYDGTHLIHQEPWDRATNHIVVVDFAFTRLLENGWSVMFDVPLVSAARTSVKEHQPGPTNPEYTTHSFGISDIRVAAYKWMFDVSTYHRGNIQLGLGIKLPTGNPGYTDYFHKDAKDETKTVVAPVNISTQLGDGGLGFTLEMNSFFTLNKTVNLYLNGFYLISPRDQNGVSGLTGNTPSPAQIRSGQIVNSVPDAYTARVGANFNVKQFILSAGLRFEGSPVDDLVGASNGLRRAGKILSVEPGISYNMKKSMIYAFVPTALYKYASQTEPDKELNAASPGGFADYLIFVGVLFKVH